MNIETAVFGLRLALAGDNRALALSILRTDSELRELEARLQKDTPDRQLLRHVCQRLRVLLDEGAPRFDAAIAGYAWALRHDPTVRTAVLDALRPAVARRTYTYAHIVFDELAGADTPAPYDVPAEATAHIATMLVMTLWANP